MDWREFEAAERNILASAPAAHWKLFEVGLRIARERLEAGADISADVAALRRKAGFTSDTDEGELAFDARAGTAKVAGHH